MGCFASKPEAGAGDGKTGSSAGRSNWPPAANGSGNGGQPSGATAGSDSPTREKRSKSVSSSAGSGKEKNEVKILLLGSGESGKSTVLKQMKIIHQNGYSQQELLMYKTTVYKNLLDCAKIVVEAAARFGVPTGLTDAEAELITTSTISPDPDTVLDGDLGAAIGKMWANPDVKKILSERRAEFYIMDSAPYFFDSVVRISDPEYIPVVDDILRARIKTTGIYETRFEMDKLKIHMYDVGGQRSERKKWIHCFENVTVIIFCVALSEYDQVLLEEKSQNRMAESLVLFDSVINSRWFTRTSVVLFLNKIDVFTEKLPHSPLENYFPDYEGGNDVQKAAKYILWRFTQANRAKLQLYAHLTQATDTSNIRFVMGAVKETILQNSLRDSGIL